MSFPSRSQIFKDPVWTVTRDVAKPSLDTFYQVDFSFAKYAKWLQTDPTSAGQRQPNWFENLFRSNQNLVSGSERLSGSNFQRKLMLLCTEAEIPGTSYLTSEALGHHQGISEAFPTLRQFPPLNLTFNLDADHVVLEVFEQWMRFINPIYTDERHNNAFTRFNYPEDYKERIHLTKYERDFNTAGTKMSQYEFINVWPTNMTSMRINYGSSAIIKLQVQLAGVFLKQAESLFGSGHAVGANQTNRAHGEVNS